VSGRGFIALGSGLLGMGLLLGVLIGRSRAPHPVPSLPVSSAPPPSAREPSRFVADRQFTETTPIAEQPTQWPMAATPVQPSPPLLGRLPGRTQPPAAAQSRPDGGTFDAAALDASPPLPEAGVIPFDAGVAFPDAAPPPAPQAAPPPPAPDPNLVRQGRVFNDSNITSSSWDEEDVSEYSVVPDRAVVPDREVTRSSFDVQDLENDHPTGP
jgi:hypothetical protein